MFVFASGRLAASTLAGIYTWQLQGLDRLQLGGVILVSANLYMETPQGGEWATFVSVARATAVLVYLMQLGLSAQYWRIKSIREVLETGGAPVYLHRLKDVEDGFHLRPLDETEPAEIAMTNKPPMIFHKAIGLLTSTQTDYSRLAEFPVSAQQVPAGRNRALLQAYQAETVVPALKLHTMDGELFDLESLRGKVVVVNFWATWCPPCVEEICWTPQRKHLLSWKRMHSRQHLFSIAHTGFAMPCWPLRVGFRRSGQHARETTLR